MAKRALITGASAGIGRATTMALAQSGVEVLAVARNEQNLQETAELAGGATLCIPADVTMELDRERIRETIGEAPIDFLLHGAGVFPRGKLEDLTLDEWRNAMATNVDARLQLVMGLRPQLARGRVLFIGSDAASTPRAGGAAYSVSKAASEMLWRCLQMEWGKEIAFGMAKPGLVATSMLDASIHAPRDQFPAGAVYEEMLRAGQTIEPKTIAAFFRWLLLECDREEFVGQIWDVRDESHQSRWRREPLYRAPAESHTSGG